MSRGDHWQHSIWARNRGQAGSGAHASLSSQNCGAAFSERSSDQQNVPEFSFV
jgi:hypothetical protein